MANTFCKIYVQIVFSTRNRENLISNDFREELYKYIAGTIIHRKSKPLAIGGTSNHIHIFCSLNPDIQLSYFVRDIKAASSKHINDSRLSNLKFEWQKGYAAFSYSESHIDKVCKYVLNQQEHHKTKTFEDEYLSFIKAYKIDYNDSYVFQ